MSVETWEIVTLCPAQFEKNYHKISINSESKNIIHYAEPMIRSNFPVALVSLESYRKLSGNINFGKLGNFDTQNYTTISRSKFNARMKHYFGVANQEGMIKVLHSKGSSGPTFILLSGDLFRTYVNQRQAKGCSIINIDKKQDFETYPTASNKGTTTKKRKATVLSETPVNSHKKSKTSDSHSLILQNLEPTLLANELQQTSQLIQESANQIAQNDLIIKHLQAQFQKAYQMPQIQELKFSAEDYLVQEPKM